MDKPKLVQSKHLPLALIDPNTGQVEGLPKNPRLIRDKNFKKLKKSIEDNPEMTALREILVYPQGDRFVIIGGNMRYEAMKSLGLETAPCKVIPKDTPVEKLRQIVLKDNSGFGEWDFELLANGWDKDLIDACCIEIPDLDKIETEEEQAEDDNFDPSDALPSKPTTQPGDIWKLGDHRLICGDSTKSETLDALMGDETADCIITDPPYNVNYEGSNGKKIENDNMSDANFQEFLVDAFTTSNNHLKQGGAFYIWHADSEGYNFRQAAKRVGWTIRQCLIWNKNSLVLGRQDYQWKHEPCLYGWKDGAGHYFSPRRDLTTVIDAAQAIDIDSLNKDELRKMLHLICDAKLPTTVIDCDKPLRNAEHPTMKPIPLIAQQMRNSTRKHDVVLDVFGGSGTTMMAAEQLGRKCYMVEYDPAYCDVIVKRWEELTGRQAERLGNIATNTDKQ
jgi:site-specific DNA-methyltransferase (adenine-specific)